MQSTAKEVSFEWSLTLHRILSTDSKVRTTLHASIIDSENERVNKALLILIQNTNKNANKYKLHRYCFFYNSYKIFV